MGGHQFYLFRRIHTGRSVISLEDKPFLHIKVEFKDGSMMLSVEELLRARRMIDGLTRVEKKIIRILLKEAECLNSGSQ